LRLRFFAPVKDFSHAFIARFERQEQEFEINRFAGAVAAGRPSDRADALVGEDRKQTGDDGAAVGRPQPQKRFAFEFAVEQRAYPRPGEPDRVPVCRFEREDEGIAERAANGARFDLGTLRCRAAAALPLPIVVEFAARRVLHEICSPALVRLHASVPERDKGAHDSPPGEGLSRARAVCSRPGWGGGGPHG
jgi:hypothetical protein